MNNMINELKIIYLISNNQYTTLSVKLLTIKLIELSYNETIPNFLDSL